MNEIIIKDKIQKERFQLIYNQYSNIISKDIELLIKNIILIFKMHSENEEYLVIAMIYWLLQFWFIQEDNELINQSDLDKLKEINLSLHYEAIWEYKLFLDHLMSMNNDLFLFKTTIKYTILSFEDKFIGMIWDPTNYYKSIWYLIPYLTFKESPFLGFFQDTYFKKVYPQKFQKIRKYYIEKVNKIEFPWEHMFNIVNSISDLMWEAWIVWKTKIRRKAYFSIYNKLERKKWEWILDNIWMRILFSNLEDLNKFSCHFEHKYVFINKKDFITQPKPNWYRSLHYRYISPYRDTQLLIEIQLRTLEMDEQIHSEEWVSHFIYTINQNKWSKHFKEVHLWYNYISNQIT